MPTQLELEARARHAVARYARLLMQDRNVTAVSVSRKEVGGQSTGEVCVRIYVARKLRRDELRPVDLLPQVLDVGGGATIVTDIVEGGPFYEEQTTGRIRPARPGASIGATIRSGTFGTIVVDNSTGQSLILSNNHVLANNNTYPIGGPILQPGPRRGGRDPSDRIATLLRYIALIGGDAENLADCAVALPIAPAMINNPPLNDVPMPSPTARAVALHIGGGIPTKWGAPIQTVLSLLNVNFPDPNSVVPAFLGQSVQKTGARTGRTVGQVTDIYGTVRISEFLFTGLIGYGATMTDGGDSGSLIVENP
jgi:hypothetical protein